MRFDKWATTAQEALQSSVTIAADAEAGQVKPIHLLKALLESGEQNLSAIIERVGADPAQVEAQVDQVISHAPRVTGDMSQMGVSTELARVGDAAEKLASKLGDSYVTTEHLLCALADEKGEAGSALKGAGVTSKRVQEAYDDLRGSERVTSQDAKTQFKALEQYGRNVTDLARQGKLDPVIGRVEEIRRTIQVLSRRTKNNPVLIG
ncbi:MAG: ATP-dependent chaperone ClpB, partial [Olsenella sp.]|nr:ATP-dependent chaperone ClpB [Olsenella sp.]